MIKVSIVILNWNRPKDTLDCLRSIRKCRIPNAKYQIIVVDNNSIDNSVTRIKKQLVKIKNEDSISSEIIENTENLGFAEGNNVGIRHALNHGADYILLLNNDTVVDKNLITEFITAAKTYPKAGVLTPKIYFAKGYEFHEKRYKKADLGRVIWYAGGDFDWENIYGTNHGVDEVDKGQFEKHRKVDFATGACMFVKKEVFETAGSFNKKYYMYLEDVELSVRIKACGWEIVFAPKAILWHKVARSSGIGGELNDYFITRNRLLFGMKYAKIRTRFALYKESLRLLARGRRWQKTGVRDFYLRRFGRGSWPTVQRTSGPEGNIEK